MNRSRSMTPDERVSEALSRHIPTWRKETLIAGVSGGVDSMSLLYILSELGVNLTVVHCNYQLRGKDSDHDQRLVEETASMWGFEVISVRLDPEESVGENFQAWARKRRYRIFRDLKSEYGATAIVTAHHQDDQLETIIQKILRGAGLTAWRGMEIWNGELFRPLLDVSKADIHRFASAHHIPYRLDNSNEESTYARNFLRNGWFPVLDDLFPGWRGNLLKIPERAREHSAVVGSLAASVRDEEGAIRRDGLLALPADVQRVVLLRILKSDDPDASVSAGMLGNLDSLADLQTGATLEVGKERKLMRDRERFVIIQPEQEDREEHIAAIRLRELRSGPKSTAGVTVTLEKWDGRIDPAVLQIDAAAPDWPLTLRRRRDGDRIRPLGMEGSQTLADHLVHARVPASEKDRALVLEALDGTICAVIFPPSSGKPGTIAETVRCGDATEEVLTIRHKTNR